MSDFTTAAQKSLYTPCPLSAMEHCGAQNAFLRGGESQLICDLCLNYLYLCLKWICTCAGAQKHNWFVLVPIICTCACHGDPFSVLVPGTDLFVPWHRSFVPWHRLFVPWSGSAHHFVPETPRYTLHLCPGITYLYLFWICTCTFWICTCTCTGTT